MKRQDSSPGNDFISSDPDHARLHLADVLFDMKENSVSEVISANNQKRQVPAIKDCLLGTQANKGVKCGWPIKELIRYHHSYTYLEYHYSLVKEKTANGEVTIVTNN